MTDLNGNVRQQLNYQGDGVAVQGVFQGGPADKAGLQPGDVITQIDGKAVTSAQEVQGLVHDKKPGESLRLQIWRGGFKTLATVTVGTAPSDFPTS
jgi:S1-C subfamily serine protease